MHHSCGHRPVIMATSFLTGAALVAGAPPVASAEPTPHPEPVGTRTVTYHGVRLDVPGSWPVIDLSAHPRTCARVDRHAVYLGTPRADADCPPRIAGRTETVSLRPIDATATTVLETGLPRSVPAGGHDASWAVEAAGITMTVTYGDEPGALDAVLAGARLTGAAHRRAAPRRAVPQAARAVPGTFRGWGFDTCQAPPSSTMDAWLASDYRAVGVYIGGGDLGCPDQPHLTAGWVDRQSGKGWHVFPLYVGHQAPCSGEPYRITKPVTQGRRDADDAIRQAGRYGMAAGTIIVNDMEFYERGGSCSTAVLTYLAAWTARLNARHYRSGVYSSRAAAIDDLVAARRKHSHQVPGTIDFAQWDGKPVTTDGHIPSGYWVHHRIKQYRGAHDETYRKRTLNIDSNRLDVR